MFHHPSVLPVSVLASAAALTVPDAASAAGFTQPRTISGQDSAYDYVLAAVAPTGRTAIVYEREIRVNRRSREQARLVLGPSPDRLSPPATLRLPGVSAGAKLSVTRLLARRDGGFVLCATAGKVQGCSIAPPGGGFGPLVKLPGAPTSLAAEVRPDGSVVLMRSTQVQTPDGMITGTTSRLSFLSSDGQLSPEREIPRSSDEQDYNGTLDRHTVLDDGTVVIAANGPDPKDKEGTVLGIRLLPPGAGAFGPIIAVPGTPSDNNIELIGGPTLTVAYRAGRGSDASQTKVVRRAADGTFSSELGIPGSGASAVERSSASASIVPLPSGELFAITTRTTTANGDFDCLNPVTGRVGSGPLAPLGKTVPDVRLSTRGQIAFDADAAVLDDGTVIAAWQNGVNEGGARRAEVAVRGPGATTFGPNQRLSSLILGDHPLLVSGGTHALLLWLAEPRGKATDWPVVASSLTKTGPYARQAPLAKHPGTACE